MATRDGDLKVLRAIKAQNLQAFYSKLKGWGETPLETGIAYEQTEAVDLILDEALPSLSGRKLDDMLGDGLLTAAVTNQAHVLRKLCQRGAAFNLVYDGDTTLLWHALISGRDAPTVETIEVLLDFGVVPRTIHEQEEMLNWVTDPEIKSLIEVRQSGCICIHIRAMADVFHPLLRGPSQNAKVDDSWVYNGKAKASKPPAGAKAEDQKMPSEQLAEVNPPADDTKSEEKKKAQPSDVLDSLKTHVNNYQTLQQQVKDAAVDKQVLASTIEMLETQITDLKARLEAAENKAKEQRAARKRARAETEALQTENKKLKKDLEATKGDLDATKAMNAELLEEVGN